MLVAPCRLAGLIEPISAAQLLAPRQLDARVVHEHVEPPESLPNAVARAYDRVKLLHGQKAAIHVFPAMPVAFAVDF
jgi:hypothetical protein